MRHCPYIRSVTHQLQPCGADLSLDRTASASTSELPFDRATDAVNLTQGAYLVEFDKTVFVRSSLWRSGAVVTAGVVDAGYKSALGAYLDIKNPAWIVLCRNAKLGQITQHNLNEKVDGHHGIYQFAENSVELDGPSGFVARR
ncbi:hypothetical protein B0H63DRAFT_500677 [Podospora didyma]|uniref:dUTPase-like domain-containing protein n=1 Tax=Podospora didyma TaxID=330526 RepID=A0AAE0U1E5_9PEZI|nr:hypothetical protein B0H63DRAFT_500677 [Podospora didyma]